MTVTPQIHQPPSQGAVRALLAATAPRAASFIVTIYGDVVEPRGGTLAMATLIDSCARHGISESLVRTAVSRATFEMLVGFQLTNEQLSYNATR